MTLRAGAAVDIGLPLDKLGAALSSTLRLRPEGSMAEGPPARGRRGETEITERFRDLRALSKGSAT